MDFKTKLLKFMYGRYGVDQLYRFLFILYFLLFFINLFIKSSIITYINIIIVIFMFYRVFSKNIYKRQLENKIYLKYKNILLKPIKKLKRNYHDRKQYVYKKCSKCKTTLRLPLPDKRGIKHVVCPECGKKITLFILRQKKIEIIRNRKEGKK